MPFDPAWPKNGQNIDADRFRGQFAGIIDLIGNSTGINAAQVDSTDTLPQGTPANASVAVVGNTLHFTFQIPQGQEGLPGLVGPAGPAFAQAVVDSVTTLNPGDAATVGVSFDGTNVRFTFGIPRGNDGSDGGQGPQGAQGPPFAQAVVDSVTTLNPGDNATVQTSFDGSNVHLQFGIPRGFPGNDGGSGPQGSPGEVSNAQLNSAVNGTSNNSNAVSMLGMTVSDPPTQGEMQAIASKLDELILALRR